MPMSFLFADLKKTSCFYRLHLISKQACSHITQYRATLPFTSTRFPFSAMTLPKSKPRIPSPSSSVDSISEDPNYDNSNITYLCHKDSISPKIELSEAQVDAILMERNLNPDPMVIHAREYQLEMFEESLKHNIIVAVGQCRHVCAVPRLKQLTSADGNWHR